MTTPTRTPTITATIVATGTVLKVDGGQVALDALAVPYGQATVELARTEDLALDDMDPRQDTRVSIAASGNGVWTPGSGGGYTPWVESRRNLHINPRADSSGAVTGAFMVTGGGSEVASWGPALDEFASCRRVARAINANAFAFRAPFTGYLASTTYRVRLKVRTSVALAAGASSINLRPDVTSTANAGGAVALPALAAGVILAVDVTVTSSATAPGANAGFVITMPSSAVGVYIEAAGILVERVPPPAGGYFDGSTPDVDLTQYSWTGTANGSASTEETRTAIPQAPPSWTPDPPRTFNLALRSREIHDVGTGVTLELATDEALLEDYATLVVDSGARAVEASVRAVVNFVLAKIGAALQAGGPDADATAYWAVSNLLPNPSCEVALAPWSAGGNCTVFHAGVGIQQPGWGVNSFGMNSQAAGLFAGVPHVPLQGPTVTPGRSYVFSGYGRAYLTTPVRTIRACIRWYSDANTPVGPDLEGPNITMNDAGWVRCSIIGVAPVGAARAEVFWRIVGGTASGQIVYVDAAMFYEGNEVVPYFDGATATTAQYAYRWATTAHQSASSRTPTVVREPDLYVWKPGTTAWDFLVPFTTTTGLRLYCDEARVWRLVDPAAQVVAGVVTLAGGNTTEGRDTISREDVDVFATGVVVRYIWEDADRIGHTAYDSAGTPSRVYVLDLERPYPGPGAAAAILARRNGTGRTQDITALVDWTATPGMEASITFPGTDESRGKIIAVTFSLGDDALMDVDTRGLIDIHAGTIDALVGTIDALVGTIDALT